MRKAARSFPLGLNSALLFAAASEGVLFLVLVAWLGYLHLTRARLIRPAFTWTVLLAGIVVVSVAAWKFYRFAQRRRFQFSLRTLLVGTFLLSALLAVLTNYLYPLQARHAANRAVVHIASRNGDFTVGSPQDAPPGASNDLTDLRNSVSVSFTGTTLGEADFAQLANIPSLASITIKNAPIREQDFLLLQHLPQLTFLVFDNTGSSDAVLERIGKIHPDWHVFRSEKEAKKWSLERYWKLKAKGEL